MARRGGRVNATGRNEGGAYAPLSYQLLQSPAWRSLSGPAAKVWLELRTRYSGANNGRLSLSRDEAARILGLGKATVGRALDELEAKGFVELKRRGKWYGRMASEWLVTDRGTDNAPPSNAWRQWQPSGNVQPSVLSRTIKTEIGSEVDP
jgi:DNA-binding transcriptional ArsR family regulator